MIWPEKRFNPRAFNLNLICSGGKFRVCVINIAIEDAISAPFLHRR
jgi:hypothetical protein